MPLKILAEYYDFFDLKTSFACKTPRKKKHVRNFIGFMIQNAHAYQFNNRLMMSAVRESFLQLSRAISIAIAAVGFTAV